MNSLLKCLQSFNCVKIYFDIYPISSSTHNVRVLNLTNIDYEIIVGAKFSSVYKTDHWFQIIRIEFEFYTFSFRKIVTFFRLKETWPMDFTATEKMYWTRNGSWKILMIIAIINLILDSSHNSIDKSFSLEPSKVFYSITWY